MIQKLLSFFFGLGFQEKESGFYLGKNLKPNRFTHQFNG